MTERYRLVLVDSRIGDVVEIALGEEAVETIRELVRDPATIYPAGLEEFLGSALRGEIARAQRLAREATRWRR